ncbi:MAG: hypothetical protein K9M75_09180 [Phycisphaerae bacterium]|nr:hypothetical protein [Phycisphaerae bacterium]
MDINKIIRIVSRTLVSLVLAGVLLFCVFGFMATFEPLERSVQIKWRLVYSIITIVCIGGFIFVWRQSGRK